MSKTRFDYVELKVRKTDEGYLVDTPIVARTGILTYYNNDGSTRKELRLPEDVFHADSLSSYAGKPITVDHPKGKVSTKDIHKYQVGTILSNGRQDGEHVRTDIVIHQPDKMGDRRELSVGYDVDLDETPGEWNGERYDAIQRNIKVNHLSIVKRGRAGAKARLNMDSDEIIDIEPEKSPMPKIRLDSGIEYEAPAEVIHAFEAARTQLSETKTKLDAVTADVAKEKAAKDALQARVDSMPAELEKARKDAETALKLRADLDKVAKSFNVDTAGKTDAEVKQLVIKAYNKDANLEGKSADYVQAMYDMAVNSRKDEGAKQQRQAVNGGRADDSRNDADEMDYQTAYKLSLGNTQKKGE